MKNNPFRQKKTDNIKHEIMHIVEFCYDDDRFQQSDIIKTILL